MELKILVATTKPLKGKWYELPSKDLRKDLEAWELEGKESLVMEIEADFDTTMLKAAKFTVREWAQMADKLSLLPESILCDLKLFTQYESFEDILDSYGQHFNFFDETDTGELMENLVKNGGYEKYVTDDELIDYIDFGRAGKEVFGMFKFFEGPDGCLVEYSG